MLVIGFGKHTGATALHKEGYTSFSQRLLEALDIVRGKTPFRFGLGVVEDSHNQIALVKAIPAEVLPERETELLKLARQLMPRLQFNYLDVLVVGCVGKDISGMGMDPNITGRFTTNIEGELKANKIVVLDLTFGTCGNAVGLGMADVTTERVLHKLDLDATWINALTSTLLQSVRIPVFMLNDRQAIQLAVKTCNCADSAQVRIAWIHNTRDLETIYVSEALWSDIAIQSEFIQSGELEAVPFDSMGNLKWNMVDS